MLESESLDVVEDLELLLLDLKLPLLKLLELLGLELLLLLDELLLLEELLLLDEEAARTTFSPPVIEENIAKVSIVKLDIKKINVRKNVSKNLFFLVKYFFIVVHLQEKIINLYYTMY